MGWRATDIPDQTGRTAVITGGNRGLGLAAARELVRAGAHVIIGCRDLDAGRRVAEELGRVEVSPLDLADLDSVGAFAAGVVARPGGIDLLINNAGVMAVPVRHETKQGFELQFGVNYLAHVALVAALLPALAERPGARVVTLSSIAHRSGAIRFSDLNARSGYRPWTAYNQSKLANLLFGLELDRRLRSAGIDIASVAAHPGIARTALGRSGPRLGGSRLRALPIELAFRLLGQSAAAGALPVLYAATSADAHGGDFIGPSWPGEFRGSPVHVLPAPQAADAEAAALLWEVSEELIGARFGLLDRDAGVPDRP